MTTPVDSANLILKLFEMRRDPVLREARDWFMRELNPETFDQLVAEVSGSRNSSFRMVAGYWDMACSLVTFGAIDKDMFLAANPEIWATMSKIYSFLPQLREISGIPEFLRHAETVVMSVPGAVDRLERTRAVFRAAQT